MTVKWSGRSFGHISRYSAATPIAALTLNFLTTTSLDSRVTFTRASAAMLTDSTGNLTYAPNNLVTFSEQFDNAAWVKTGATVSANVAIAPNGTTTADKLVEDGTTGLHRVDVPYTVVSGLTYVVSVYAKAAEASRLQIVGAGFAAQGFSAVFNVSSGTVQINTGSRGTIQSVGDGWYRCSIWVVSSVTTGFSLQITDNSGNQSYTGTPGNGLLLWGAQVEQVTYQTTPGTYVATTSSAYQGPRFDYDPVTLAPKGLLIEEQRSNLVTYSEQFDNAAWGATGGTISANSTTSPDGTVDADSFVEAVGSTDPRIPRTVTLVIGTTYALSVYAKIIPGSAQRYLMLVFNAGFAAQPGVNFDLVTGTVGTTNGGATGTITAVGNGWYRCSIVTPAATATSASFRYRIASVNTSGNIAGPTAYTGDGTSGYYFYGAQLEAGAFATSYIPTVASQVTRSADVATMTGTNFSGWYNQSEGTFVAGFSQLYSQQLVGTQGGIVRADDGTNNNQISIVKQSNTNQIWGTITSGGANGLNGNTGPHNANETKTAALAYKSGDSAGVLSGGTPLTSASANVPTALDRLRIGSSSISAGAWMLNGHIRSIAYYNTRLSNAQLQALTA